MSEKPNQEVVRKIFLTNLFLGIKAFIRCNEKNSRNK